MITLSNCLHGVVLIGVTLMLLLLIGWFATKLADSHAGDVRVVCYFFSLSFVCTSLVATWANGVGAIDKAGQFQGQFGPLINDVLAFMLDLQADVFAFAAILIVVVVPQGACYVLSGLFGCAAAPLFVGDALQFFVWGVVKSFVVASGIVLALAVCGAAHGWTNFQWSGLASMLFTALSLLVVSFGCLFMYRDAAMVSPQTETDGTYRGGSTVRRVKAWMTRKSSMRTP